MKLLYLGGGVTKSYFHVKHIYFMTNTKNHRHFYRGIKLETYYSRDEIKERITDDYIRGLMEGESHFGADRRGEYEVPTFVLKMHVRDKELIEAIRDYFGFYHPVYEYKIQGRHFAMLIIRDIYTLKNKIVPLCKGKLLGFKGTQFDWWLKYFPYLNSLIYRNNK